MTITHNNREQPMRGRDPAPGLAGLRVGRGRGGHQRRCVVATAIARVTGHAHRVQQINHVYIDDT